MTVMTLFYTYILFTSFSFCSLGFPLKKATYTPPKNHKKLPYVSGKSESVVICRSFLQNCCLWILKLLNRNWYAGRRINLDSCIRRICIHSTSCWGLCFVRQYFIICQVLHFWSLLFKLTSNKLPFLFILHH